MRYSSHPPRAFRNRIAKSIGVLVAAALSRHWGCRVPRRLRRQRRRWVVTFDEATAPRSPHCDVAAASPLWDNWMVRFRPSQSGCSNIQSLA